LSLTTLGQETRWAYSTTPPSPHGARIEQQIMGWVDRCMVGLDWVGSQQRSRAHTGQMPMVEPTIQRQSEICRSCTGVEDCTSRQQLTTVQQRQTSNQHRVPAAFSHIPTNYTAARLYYLNFVRSLGRWQSVADRRHAMTGHLPPPSRKTPSLALVTVFHNKSAQTSVLFFSRRRSEGWPRHGVLDN